MHTKCMEKQIQEIKNQIENRMAINYVKIGIKENYLAFCRDNGGYFAGLKSTIEELQKWGDKTIQVHTDGGESPQEMAKVLRRIDKIATKAGYINQVTAKKRFQEMDGIRQEWIEISGLFIRI